MRGRIAGALVLASFTLWACSTVLGVEDPIARADAGLDGAVDSNVEHDSALADSTVTDAGLDAPPVDLGISCGATYCDQDAEECSLPYCMGPDAGEKCVPRGTTNQCVHVKCTDNLDCQTGAVCCTTYDRAGGYVPPDAITGASCFVGAACPVIQMCNPSHLECPAGSTCLSTKPAGYYSCQ